MYAQLAIAPEASSEPLMHPVRLRRKMGLAQLSGEMKNALTWRSVCPGSNTVFAFNLYQNKENENDAPPQKSWSTEYRKHFADTIEEPAVVLNLCESETIQQSVLTDNIVTQQSIPEDINTKPQDKVELQRNSQCRKSATSTKAKVSKKV